MILIVGLGNPGRKFAKTRHNIGFSILDKFKRRKNFSRWQEKTKLKAKISEGKISRKKIILAKPQTFMNNSGISVRLLVAHYSYGDRPYWACPISLFVVHDDLAISLGQIKISKGKGPAGHKGVQSIIDELGTKDFVRFRIGISRFAGSQKLKVKSQKLDRFVLEKITKQEQKILKQVKKRACQALDTAIKGGVEKAMTEFN